MAFKPKPNAGIAQNNQAALDVAAAEFISGSATAQAEQIQIPAPTPEPAFIPANDRVNKTIRISKALETKLKREALKRSEKSGARVTESDLIEVALHALFSK